MAAPVRSRKKSVPPASHDPLRAIRRDGDDAVRVVLCHVERAIRRQRQIARLAQTGGNNRARAIGRDAVDAPVQVRGIHAAVGGAVHACRAIILVNWHMLDELDQHGRDVARAALGAVAEKEGLALGIVGVVTGQAEAAQALRLCVPDADGHHGLAPQVTSLRARTPVTWPRPGPPKRVALPYTPS